MHEGMHHQDIALAVISIRSNYVVIFIFFMLDLGPDNFIRITICLGGINRRIICRVAANEFFVYIVLYFVLFFGLKFINLLF